MKMTLHGLIFWCFESFVRFTYGAACWRSVMQDMDLGFESFGPVFRFDSALADRLVERVAQKLDKNPDALLEDFGTFLVTDERVERVRRLLRFSGVDYTDFLLSLEDLRGRAQLAVPELDLPALELDEIASDEFHVTCRNCSTGTAHVLLGMLRALADDYGALVYIESLGRRGMDECLSIRLLEMQHSEGRTFNLSVEASP